MSQVNDLFDYRDSSEDSSLVLLLGLIKNGEADLRDFMVGQGVNTEDLDRVLMEKVEGFDYQDDDRVRSIFQRARAKRQAFGEGEGDVCLLAATLSYGRCLACQVLSSLGLDCSKLYHALSEEHGFERNTFSLKGFDSMPSVPARAAKSFVFGPCGTDLTEYYKNNPGKVFKGRGRELDKMVRILGKMNNGSVLILGPSGTGKTALVDEFSARLARGEIKGHLAGFSVIKIDLESMDPPPADFSKVRDFLFKAIPECRDKDNKIFFLDWQTVELKDGDVFSTFNALNLLKQFLRESGVRLILVGCQDAYEDFLMDFPDAAGLAEVVKLDEPNQKEVMEVLRSVKGSYEVYHGLNFSDEALRMILSKSDMVDNGTRLPGRALELLDAVGSHFSSKGVKQVNEGEVKSFCAKEESVSISGGRSVGKRRLSHLAALLRKSVIGQDGPCQKVADAVVSLSDPEAPVASFFFVGPSGVGKTLLAKMLAKALFREEDAFFRFDMSEYFDRHEVSRLIGSPPGYIGHDSGGQLTEKLRKRPEAVVLFDEIEKADPSIYNIFLQILSDGVLTDGKGNQCSFTQAVVIMTSNIDIRKGGPLGFSACRNQGQAEMDLRNALQKNNFRRELVGRIDEIVEFNSLSRADFLKIVDLELEKIKAAAFKRGVKKLTLSDEAKEFLVDSSETAEYGARNLNRTLRRHLRIPLGNFLLSSSRVSRIDITLNSSSLVFN